MTTLIDPALVARLSGEFTDLGTRMGALGRDLDLLRDQLAPGVGGSPAGGVEGSAAAGSSPRGSGAPAGDPAGVWKRPVPAGEPAPSGAAVPGVPPAAASGGSGSAPASADSAGGVPVPAGGVAVPSPARPVAAGSPPVPTGWPNAANAPMAPGVPMAPGSQGGWRPAPAGAMPRPPAPPNAWPAPGQGLPPHGQRPPGTPPPYTRPPRTTPPWWQREGVVSRLLAVAGVAVTLTGVVMLLVLAAQAGWFGPIPRVAAGAVFSAALVAAGIRVSGRTGGRIGGIALAATGIAGAYLDVLAVTTLYGWLHPVPGLAVAFGIAAGGVALAMQWRSQPFAVLVVAGVAVLSPAVTGDLALVAFLIALMAACLPVHRRFDWPVLQIARTLPAVLATLWAVGDAVINDPIPARELWILAAAVVIALLGAAGVADSVRRRPNDIVATVAFALSTVPLLSMPALFDRPAAAVVSGGTAAALLGAAALTSAKIGAALRIPPHTRATAAVAGALALLATCVTVTADDTLPIALLAVAAAFLALAGQAKSLLAALLGTAFGVLGTGLLFTLANTETLTTQRLAAEELGFTTAVAALIAVAVAGLGLRCLRTVAPNRDTSADTVFGVIAALIALYAVTVTTVSIGVATGAADGFVAGHSAATILWMAGATAALFYGLRLLTRTPAVAKVALVSGLLVTAAALAKLFLFDLATLDGLVRVLAFLAVGVLLLLAGTRYARAFAEAAERQERSPVE